MMNVYFNIKLGGMGLLRMLWVWAMCYFVKDLTEEQYKKVSEFSDKVLERNSSQKAVSHEIDLEE